MGPYCLKCEQKCGCVFGKVRAKNWTHICENASNSLASYLGRRQQQPGPLFGKVQAINWAHIFEKFASVFEKVRTTNWAHTCDDASNRLGPVLGNLETAVWPLKVLTTPEPRPVKTHTTYWAHH